MNYYRKLGASAGVMVAALLLASCAKLYSPTPIVTDVKENTAISSTAGLSHVFVRNDGTRSITCSQPPPDAAFDQAESGSVGLSISFGGNEKAGEEESSSELEMSGRTPAVLMSRELFYRACEFSMNFKLNKGEATTLYMKTLDSVTKVWAVEAGNTKVTVGDELKTDNKTAITETIATDGSAPAMTKAAPQQ